MRPAMEYSSRMCIPASLPLPLQILFLSQSSLRPQSFSVFGFAGFSRGLVVALGRVTGW